MQVAQNTSKKFFGLYNISTVFLRLASVLLRLASFVSAKSANL
jgi:hypothetical protein